MEILALIMFILVFALILSGYPVGLVLAGVSILFGIFFVPDFLDLLPLRIMGIMENQVLIAVPLFIFMGLMFERSGLAEKLLVTMSMLLGRMHGGLAISVIIVGTLLAASSGIVGATVVTMGLISLPVMLKKGYSAELASGTICSSGTLGQIIPPSVVLILLGSVMNVSVGDLFKSALLPGLLLVLLYVIFIFIYAFLRPQEAPRLTKEEILEFKADNDWKSIMQVFVFPVLLILAVLGSIFAGVATPTEAAALGALGASLLAMYSKKFNLKNLKYVSKETTYLTSMVFLILLGATTLSLVFRGLGGERYLVEAITSSGISAPIFLLLVMIVVFIAGFFIDFIEIVFIIVPVVSPILIAYKIDLVWFAILLAVNLQTSFLSPPFGFALFYLKGVAPPELTTAKLYKGIVPFIIIQLLVLAMLAFVPDSIYWIYGK